VKSEPLTVSVLEAARLLGIDRNLAYRLVKIGKIPTVRLGRRYVVPKAAILKLLDVSGGLK
jgi:excisionase family DNA binding protein